MRCTASNTLSFLCIVVSKRTASSFVPGRLLNSLEITRRVIHTTSSSSLSSVSFGNVQDGDKDGTSSTNEDDLARWENMYFEGEMKKAQSMEDLVEGISEVSNTQVRVISFDLDNTLWKTGPTIQAANDALSSYLDERNIVQPERTEVVMGQLFKANKLSYTPDLASKGPVFLTQLRKDALVQILQHHNGYSLPDATSFADTAFSVWTDARHSSTLSYLATDVVGTLQRLCEMRTLSGNPVVMGAITDGNSDPRTIATFAPFFDFVVNAESVGVSKPDRGVYQAAVREIAKHPALRDLFGGGSEDGTDEITDDMVADLIGAWWVHIGDDFVKDIVAAKDMGMRTIWAQELVKDKLAKEEKEKVVPEKPQRSLEDFMKEIADKQVITMQLGADDFLAQSIEDDFVDATAEYFPDIATTILEWHARGQGNSAAAGAPSIPTRQSTVVAETNSMTEPGILTVIEPDAEEAAAGSAGEKKTKFCMFCGTKILMAANFCPTCGGKQPQL